MSVPSLLTQRESGLKLNRMLFVIVVWKSPKRGCHSESPFFILTYSLYLLLLKGMLFVMSLKNSLALLPAQVIRGTGPKIQRVGYWWEDFCPLFSPAVPQRSWFLQRSGRRSDGPVHPGDRGWAGESTGHQGGIHRGTTQQHHSFTTVMLRMCSYTKTKQPVIHST